MVVILISNETIALSTGFPLLSFTSIINVAFPGRNGLGSVDKEIPLLAPAADLEEDNLLLFHHNIATATTMIANNVNSILLFIHLPPS